MKTILVPSDFSTNASAALRYAIQLSRIMKANLIVFHCAQLSPYFLTAAAASEEKMNLLIKEDESFKLKKLRAQVNTAYKYLGYKQKPDTTKLIVESNPLVVDNIMEVGQKYHADLIVTATHGATGLNRFFFGSNTAILISKSTIPVLAIPEKYSFKKIKRIVYSTDLENAENDLARLIPFAKALKSTIDMLYLDYGIDVNEAHVHAAEACIRKSGYKKIRLVKHNASIEFSMIRQIKNYLADHNQQWLVMFTRERSFWDKLLFGGKTENMSYSLKIPLLSFKKS